MKKVLLLLSLVVLVFVSCRNDAEEIIAPEPTPPEVNDSSPVVFDPSQVPYATLSAYNFFEVPLSEMKPVQGVLPYDVITPLFSDYAHKKRFVWMPEGVSASYVNAKSILDFPDGTVLIKSFYFDNVLPGNTRRILETRLLFKVNGEWQFADYKWNAEQTEAYFDLNGSINPLDWVDEQGITRHVDFRIPAGAECHTCHKISGIDTPIGPKLRNLDRYYSYESGVADQLQKWEQMGYLSPGYPTDAEAVVAWDDPTQTLTDRVRAYVDMNCAHCHDEGRHCDYRPMRFAWQDTEDAVNLGVCIPPEDPIDPSFVYIVAANNVNRSMLYHRITSTAEDVRMPLLGRTVVHEEAVQLIEDWINSLPEPCN